jgi:hypothetical protein
MAELGYFLLVALQAQLPRFVLFGRPACFFWV